MRAVLLIILFGGYSAALGLLVAADAGHLFFARSTIHNLISLGLGAGFLLLTAIVIYALVRPTRKKLLGAGVSVALFIALPYCTSPITAWSDRLWVQRHRGELETFAADIAAYPRIRSMTDGAGYLKYVNGTHVAYTEAERDSVFTGQDRRPLVATVLQRDGIDPVKYEEYRRRLREFGFWVFWAQDEGFTFGRTRDDGLVYRPSEQSPLHVGGRLGSRSDARIVEVLGPGWYWAAW
jgi:hypothetical protein